MPSNSSPPRRRWKRAAALLPFAALATQAAPAAFGDLDPGQVYGIYLDSIAGNGPATRTIACDLDGDYLREIVVVQGGSLFAALGPSLARMPITLSVGSGTPIDAARLQALPDEFGDRRDLLACAHTAGVTIATFDGSGTPTVVAELTGAWVNARRIASIDTDGDGTDELVGLNAAGNTVLIAAWVNGALTHHDTIHLPSGHVGTDLAGVRADANASFEVAVTCATSVDVIRVASNTVNTISMGAEVLGTVALTRTGETVQRLAVATTIPSTPYFMLHVMTPAGVVESTLPLGFLDITALRAGDVDGDADDDLFLWHRYSYELLVVRNVSAAGSTIPTLYDPALDVQILDLGGDVNASDNGGGLGLDDFDCDGDLDAAAMIEATGFGMLALNGSNDALEQSYSLLANDEEAGFTLGEGTTVASVQFNAYSGSSPLLPANEIEVTIWALERDAPATEAFPVETIRTSVDELGETLVEVQGIDLDGRDHYFFAQLRGIEYVGGSGVVARRGPSTAWYLELDRADLEANLGGFIATASTSKIGDILPRPILPPPPPPPPGGGGGGG
ncbi:MAG: hypothetical protein JNL90_05280 [Planctomycetes bacterium]|nr:hypothetical protein [Planctomycetota bacterium]